MSKFLGTKVVLSRDSIAKATGCLHEGSTYQEGWEKNYKSHVARALYKENIDKAGEQKIIIYNLMCKRAKIWANILNKSVLHKAGSKTSLLDLHKFVLSHLMENLPFDLPHIIYINILSHLKGLSGLDDNYYVVLINNVLWDQGVYHVFDKMDSNSKHTIIPKGYVVAKQQKLSKNN